MKAFLIGGTSSGSGKTTLTLGLLRALALRGLRVQPFKVGPDYIDTGWHSRVSGVPSRNLDAFMLPGPTLQALFRHHAAQADVAVIEGVMGLFDGYGVDPLHCSSAGMAHLLGCPVILVVDGKAVSTSAAATVLGFKLFSPHIHLAGVILNRVNSPEHYALLKRAIETHCQVPVLGRVPVMADVSLPERHLGLFTAHDALAFAPRWDALAEVMARHIDLDALLRLAELPPSTPSATASTVTSNEVATVPLYPDWLAGSGEGLTLALAEDEAFNFYYPDNLELLEAAGVKLVRFSPLRDSRLPPCDMVYLGGGYPELHAQQLAENVAMREALHDAHQRGVAIYAECGGLMYLGEWLVTSEGERWPMVGILPGESRMNKTLTRFGYCQATALQDTLLAARGETLRGHEFHYSDFHTTATPVLQCSKTRDGVEMAGWQGGYQVGNTLASYLHVHFLQQPALLQHWFARARSSL